MIPIELATGVALVLGLLIGSFLNVVIYRLPNVLFYSWKQECLTFLEQKTDITEEPPGIVLPRSHCPKCKALVKPWQNIPVISYFLLRGKCGSCHAPISKRYPIVELVTGLLSAYAIFTLSVTPAGGLALILTWSLVVLTMIDIDHQILPDTITLPLLWLGLIANYFGVFTDLHNAVLGAAFGYLSLWSFYWIFKLITKKEGMGFGDFKLLAALGAWLGWKMLLPIILLSSMVGAVVGIAGIIILGRNKNIPIPFGPYLATAGLIAFYWGDTIVATYLDYAKIH